MVKVNITIIENNVMFRELLVEKIERNYALHVNHQTSSAHELLDEYHELETDILIISDTIDDAHPLRLISRIHTMDQNVPIIFIHHHLLVLHHKFGSMHQVHHVNSSKQSMTDLLHTIKGLIPPHITAFYHENTSVVTHLFTPREVTTLKLLSKGFPIKEIACELGISTTSVDVCKKTLREKVRVNTTSELLVYCAHQNII